MLDLPEVTDAPRGSRVAWIYGGVWGVLARGFLVPEEPPVLPSVRGEPIRSFRPAPGFLKYLLYPSLLSVGIMGLALLAGGIILSVTVPVIGIPALAVLLPVFVFWMAIVVLAVHLRYDTTWYVLSDRSLRIRRGIWIIRETTITFENVQNVTVRQGPLQRFFGIADAPAIRDLLTAKMRASKSAGLGDDLHTERRAASGFSTVHIAALREVRDVAHALIAAS